MGFDAHFIHRCVIERMACDENIYGNSNGALELVARNQPCRLVEESERLVVTERAQSLIQTKYKLFLPAGSDLKEKDVISEIKLEDGAIIDDSFVVKSVVLRRAASLSFLSVALERAS